MFSSQMPSGLDLLVAIVGEPGDSKTKAGKLGRMSMPVPDVMDCPMYLLGMIDGLSISSGPGLIESFMGVEDGERKQVHNNGLFYCDEGSVLEAISARNGEILDEILRCIFAGTPLSTPNATKDRWRYVEGYCIGVVINMTPKAVGPLLPQSSDGSPQRFLWFSAVDPNMPRFPEKCEPARNRATEGGRRDTFRPLDRRRTRPPAVAAADRPNQGRPARRTPWLGPGKGSCDPHALGWPEVGGARRLGAGRDHRQRVLCDAEACRSPIRRARTSPLCTAGTRVRRPPSRRRGGQSRSGGGQSHQEHTAGRPSSSPRRLEQGVETEGKLKNKLRSNLRALWPEASAFAVKEGWLKRSVSGGHRVLRQRPGRAAHSCC